jgi:hypothetical protein
MISERQLSPAIMQKVSVTRRKWRYHLHDRRRNPLPAAEMPSAGRANGRFGHPIRTNVTFARNG